MSGKYERQNMKAPNSGKRTKHGGRGGGRVWGWLGDGHRDGELTGWALGVMLYVGKLNTNKNKFIKVKNEPLG